MSSRTNSIVLWSSRVTHIMVNVNVTEWLHFVCRASERSILNYGTIFVLKKIPHHCWRILNCPLTCQSVLNETTHSIDHMLSNQLVCPSNVDLVVSGDRRCRCTQSTCANWKYVTSNDVITLKEGVGCRPMSGHTYNEWSGASLPTFCCIWVKTAFNQ